MRALKGLAVLLVVLAGGGWFGAKLAVERAVAAWFAGMAAEGKVAEYSALSVGGFPAALDLRMTNLRLADPVSGTGWQAPLISVHAASWAPWHLTAALPAEQVLTLPTEKVTLASTGLQATLGAAPALALPLREVTVSGQSLTARSSQGWTLGVGDFALTLRPDDSRQEGSYVLSVDLAPLHPDPKLLAALGALALPDLPAPDFPDTVDQLEGTIGLALTAPLALNSGAPMPQVQAVDVRGFDARWGKLELNATGRLEADAEGYATGHIALELTNWDRLPTLLVAAGLVKPALAPTIANGLRAMAAQGPDPTVLNLSLDMAEGRMALGPFPLGEAPRLRRPEGA